MAYQLLVDVDPETADALLSIYGPTFLRAGRMSEQHLPEVPDTVALVVADEWEPPLGTARLRLTSWYTGTTYWKPTWGGSIADAERWVRDVAQMNGEWVLDEHRQNGGRPAGPWDEP